LGRRAWELTEAVCGVWGGHQGILAGSYIQIKAPRYQGPMLKVLRHLGSEKCGATSKIERKDFTGVEQQVKITAGQSFCFLTLDFYCRNAFEVEELLLISWRSK